MGRKGRGEERGGEEKRGEGRRGEGSGGEIPSFSANEGDGIQDVLKRQLSSENGGV